MAIESPLTNTVVACVESFLDRQIVKAEKEEGLMRELRRNLISSVGWMAQGSESSPRREEWERILTKAQQATKDLKSK